jgi:C4-dicarboxylate-specific signal transduction histidine kinase
VAAGKVIEAEEEYNNITALAETVNVKSVHRDLMKVKANLFAAKGDYQSAHQALIEFMQISEEAYTEERRQEIEKLKLAYDTERKEFRNKLLSSQNRKLNREVSKQSEIIRQNERQLFAQEKYATVGKMYANFAHEIKAPFQMLYNGLCEFEELVDTVENNLFINRNRDKLKNRIDRSKWTIDYVSRSVRNTEDFRLEEVNLNDVINDYRDYLAETILESGTEIKCELAKDLPVILGDWGRLTQVISNLVKNASEALKQAGYENGLITIRTLHYDDKVILEILDNGPGIRGQNVNELFRQFFTTKKHGLGLGLYNVRKFTEQMNGEVEAIDNSPRPGATFRLVFPGYVSAVRG